MAFSSRVGHLLRNISKEHSSNKDENHPSSELHQLQSKTRSGTFCADKESAKAAESSDSGGSGKRKTIAQNRRQGKRPAYGLYTFREVMGVIRLFWSLDNDNSGEISVDELIDSEVRG